VADVVAAGAAALVSSRVLARSRRPLRTGQVGDSAEW